MKFFILNLPVQKRDEDENIKSNMSQYGLESRFLDAVVADFSQPLWRADVQFDAIIADRMYFIKHFLIKLLMKKISVSPIRCQGVRGAYRLKQTQSICRRSPGRYTHPLESGVRTVGIVHRSYEIRSEQSEKQRTVGVLVSGFQVILRIKN